ncbi:uncharacterized protein LOC135942229 [Cloeon dipterum]|uniref:uncharacterized protein LOC135942229 n=1 Tax=Cloeon dipterum TaxID=197152 RepID=UPI00322080B0
MEEILKRGETQGRPTGPANLGFFQSESGKQNAENVFVLVVHYDFKNHGQKFRNCDAPDVEKLETTFGKDRNCNFRGLFRPKKEILLDLLGNQEKLLRFFASKDKIPSVFVLFFLSHGNENGVIGTDYWNEQENDFISFTTEEVFDSLKNLHGFEQCLKLVNFGPCRGKLEDAKFDRKKDYKDYENKNSCRITMAPDMPNTVIIYSTVETTMANTSERGSWFVSIMCDVLNRISEDKLLLLFLTSVQHKMHKASIAGPDFATNLHLGQTPEVKMFPLDRNFSFSRALTAAKTVSRTDSRMEKAATITSTSEFFSWKSDDGKNIRGRRAFIFYEQQTLEVEETEKALRQNLDFDTRLWKLKKESLDDYYKQVNHDVGCVLTCIFGQVSEKERTREVCVLVNGEEKPIADILHGFIGPKNERLIGKPKIFFIIDQKAQECDSSKFEVSSTNHSGWLVMILKEKEFLQRLIGILKGDELKKGRSLQELLEPLLTTGAKKEFTLLNSTLQYLIDFPDWPRTFVKPDFKLKGYRKKIGFDDLIKEAKRLRENQVWLLSSVAGAGKTTVLKEIAFQLGKSDQDAKILNISLKKHFVYILSISRVDVVQFLVETTGYSAEDIQSWIAHIRIVVFLDGFDEVCPHSREKVLKIVRALRERGIPLCVATRPHEAKVIEKAVVNVKLLEIEPLDEEKQKEFLQSVFGKDEEEIKRVFHAIKQISFSNSDDQPYKDKNRDNVLVNPLLLLLVAQSSGEGNLYLIYDKVVRKKVEMCLVRENGYNKVASEKIEIALNLLRLIAFRFIKNKPLDGGGVTREDLAKMNDYGVATVEQETVTFLHRTFAEFLAAQHFLKNVEESSTFDMEFISKWNMEQVRKFVDLFYSTLEKEKDIEFHTQMIVFSLTRYNEPQFLMIQVCRENLKQIFRMVRPHMNICDEQTLEFSNIMNLSPDIAENDVIHCGKHRSFICVKYAIKLLVVSIRSEEIAIELLKMNVIDSRTLEKYMDEVLEEIAKFNAISVFNQLKETFPNKFIKLLQKFKCGAGCTAVERDNDEILELFLENGFNVNSTKYHSYENALFLACYRGRLKCVQILLKHGAKLAITDACCDNQVFIGKIIWDPLNVAVRFGHLDIVKLILEEGTSGLARDTVTLEANIFVFYDEKPKSDYIATFRDEFNAFQYAIFYRKMEIAEYLLSKSPALKHIKTGNGMSPLQLAVDCRHGEFLVWLTREVGDDLTSLIPSGERQDWTEDDHFIYDHFLLLRGDLTKTDERGKTLLHVAAQHRHLQLVRDFIEKGTDVAAKDADGWNALHFACTFTDFINYHDNSEVVKLLHLTNPRLVKETTNNGETVLHILVNNSYCNQYEEKISFSRETFRFLVDEAGVDLEAKDRKGRTAKDVADDDKPKLWNVLNQ